MPPGKAPIPENNFIKIIGEIRSNNTDIDNGTLCELFSEKLIDMFGGFVEGYNIKYAFNMYCIQLFICGDIYIVLFVQIIMNKYVFSYHSIQFIQKFMTGFDELYEATRIAIIKEYHHRITKNIDIIKLKEKMDAFNIPVDDPPAE